MPLKSDVVPPSNLHEIWLTNLVQTLDLHTKRVEIGRYPTNPTPRFSTRTRLRFRCFVKDVWLLGRVRKIFVYKEPTRGRRCNFPYEMASYSPTRRAC